MLTSEDIAQINEILGLCDTYLLNDYEIDLMNKIYVQLGLSGLVLWSVLTSNGSGVVVDQNNDPVNFATPVTICQYYEITQQVLIFRSKTDSTIQSSISTLEVLAGLDGCTIEPEPAIVVDVDIPYFGGGLSS